MIGITFRNIHSSTFKIGVKSVNRSVLPSLRKNEFTIPGRHGTIDYGLNTYEKRNIPVKISVAESVTFEELRDTVRDIAKWLSGKGLLIFDDEPDKAYQASVYEPVDADQLLECLPYEAFTVTFECQPFAESLEYRGVNTPHITTQTKEISLTVNGTAETGCIITIKNTGATIVSGISLRRKVAI